jgi:uncharacterized protein (TIGR02246 family)
MRRTLAIAAAGLIAVAVVGVNGSSATGPPTSGQGARTSALQAARDVPQRVVGAWARNDAEAFGAVWTADGDLVVGDGTRLVGRRAITAYMRTGFAGPLKGARATATVTRARLLSPTVAVVQTRGGILMPGETKVPPGRLGVQTWVVTKQGPRWLISAYQNTRIDQR